MCLTAAITTCAPCVSLPLTGPQHRTEEGADTKHQQQLLFTKEKYSFHVARAESVPIGVVGIWQYQHNNTSVVGVSALEHDYYISSYIYICIYIYIIYLHDWIRMLMKGLDGYWCYLPWIWHSPGTLVLWRHF